MFHTIPHQIRMTLGILLVLAFISNHAGAQEGGYKPGDRIEYRASGFPEKWEIGVYDGATPGGGLLTQGEILAFLKDRLGETPFADSGKLQQTKLELTELIKKRGLDFRYEVLSDFGNQIVKFGMTSEVTFPLQSNFGPPRKYSWFNGIWALGKIAPKVTHVRGDYLVTQGEFGVSDLGVLSLQHDGTYTWKVWGETEPIRGSWREATPEEMKDQGGAGIVLIKAKTGYDWIVTPDRNTPVKGHWINISELRTRQIREFGERKN